MRINVWLKREPNLDERKRGEGYRKYPSPGIGLGHSQSQSTALYCYNRFRFQSRNLFVWGEIFLGHVRSDVHDVGIAGYGAMDLLLPISMGIANPFC